MMQVSVRSWIKEAIEAENLLDDGDARKFLNKRGPSKEGVKLSLRSLEPKIPRYLDVV